MVDLDSSGANQPTAGTPHPPVEAATMRSREIILPSGETRKVGGRSLGDGHRRDGALIAPAISGGVRPAPFARSMLKNPGQALCQGREAVFSLQTDGDVLRERDIPDLLPSAETTLAVRLTEPSGSRAFARAALAIDGRTAPYIACSQAP